MSDVIMGLIALVVLIIFGIVHVATSKEGYEDETGFHFGKLPEGEDDN